MTQQERLERGARLIKEFPADIIFVARGDCLSPSLAQATNRTWIALPRVGYGAGLITTWKQPSAGQGEVWNGLGARLRSEDGREVVAFPLAMAFSPFQPYQLLGIAHDERPFLSTADAAVESASAARGLLCEQIAAAARAASSAGLAVMCAGMVNEPSALDWGDQAVAAELCPMRVDWPSVRILQGAGLIDSFRALNPDALKAPGATFPAVPMKRDRSERVDFMLVNGRLRCASIEIVGEVGEAGAAVAVGADQSKPPAGRLPGDHRGLIGEFHYIESGRTNQAK